MITEPVTKGSGPGHFQLEPIDGRTFGARISFVPKRPLDEIVDALHAQSDELLEASYSVGGLIVLADMHDITSHPRLLLSIR